MGNSTVKEILYFNKKTNSMGLKIVRPRVTAEMMVAVDLALLRFNGDNKHWSSEELEKMIQDVQVQECSCKLAEGDKFNLNVAYAVLFLNAFFGSRRKRENHLKAQYGELLTSESYNMLVITYAMDILGMSYNEYVKHVKDISVGEMPA